MTLSLKDVLKNAEERGIVPSNKLLRPWQEGSIFYVEEKEQENKVEQDVIPSIDFKGATKGPQRSHNKEDTKEIQRDYKGITKETQLNPKGATKGPLKGLHKGPQREHKKLIEEGGTKEPQRDYKYSHLKGWNKKVVELIHDICRETVSKVTYPMTNTIFSEMLNMPIKSVKTTMQRLKSKGEVIVTEFCDGRGGWSKYTLPEEFFNDIPQTERVIKNTEKGPQRDYKGATKGATQGDTNDSRRRDFINIDKSSSISDEWDFDISPYERFGFTQTKLKQLITVNKLSAEEVQQSLDEFEYDVTHNTLPKIETTRINYLMGGLIKGSPYTSDAYQKKINQAANEMKARYEERQLEQQKITILSWYENLNDADKKAMESTMPTYLKIRYDIDGIFEKELFAWITDYYRKAITKCNG